MESIRPKLRRPHVEYNVTEHCNLSCYQCDHASPLLPQKFASVEDFSRDLTALAQVLHTTELRILGGEPLLHQQIIMFLEEARRIGISDSIVLYTNGLLLHRVAIEFWRLVDEVRISIYPGVKINFSEADGAEVTKLHGSRITFLNMQEFQKTLTNEPIKNADLVQAIYNDCKNKCHVVHDGFFYRCSVAPFMSQRLALRGCHLDNAGMDGVQLHDNEQLYQHLDSYLQRDEPLAACTYCLGTAGPMIPTRQLNRSGRLSWLQENTTQDIETVRNQLLGEPRPEGSFHEH